MPLSESRHEVDPNLRLWNDTPATEWLAAFPIGNGQIGGMVFGGIEQERIGLNHERLWRGVTRDRTTENVSDQLPSIQEAFFSGDMAKGAAMAEEILGGKARRIMPYQPIGDLWIEAFDDTEEASAYERELDLIAGVAATNWRRGQFELRRLSFVSADHNALVVHLETTDPAGISIDVRLDRATEDEHPGKPESPYVDPDDITLTGWSRGNRAGLFGLFKEGISFATEFRVVSEGGEVSSGDSHHAKVSVQHASSITIVLGITVKTESHIMNGRDAIASHLDAVPTSFESLLAAHLEEHVPAMERVRISLPTPAEAASLPLRKRLSRLREGQLDPGLTALYFNYGRYLLFSSSRKCSEPANLQGIWCQELEPAWQSDFHLNINIQMNYWPAEVANLSECLTPLVNFIERFVSSARQTARRLVRRRRSTYAARDRRVGTCDSRGAGVRCLARRGVVAGAAPLVALGVLRRPWFSRRARLSLLERLRRILDNIPGARSPGGSSPARQVGVGSVQFARELVCLERPAPAIRDRGDHGSAPRPRDLRELPGSE